MAAAVVGLGALAAGLVYVTGESAPFGETVALADATPAMLDTVALRGQRVEASLNGTVLRAEPGGRVRLAVAEGSVRLRFDEAPAVDVGDRLLVVGRVRSRGRRRHVDVASWAVVRVAVRPPAAAGL